MTTAENSKNQRQALSQISANAEEGGMENTTKRIAFRITAENVDNGATRTLATSHSLENLAKRVEKDAEFWDDRGWEGLMLEDDAMGYFTELLREDLDGQRKRGELSREAHRILRAIAC